MCMDDRVKWCTADGKCKCDTGRDAHESVLVDTELLLGLWLFISERGFDGHVAKLGKCTGMPLVFSLVEV